jgi:hypothetical protein
LIVVCFYSSQVFFNALSLTKKVIQLNIYHFLAWISQVQHWLNQLCDELNERICCDLDQNKRIAHTFTVYASAYKVLISFLICFPTILSIMCKSYHVFVLNVITCSLSTRNHIKSSLQNLVHWDMGLPRFKRMHLIYFKLDYVNI